MLIKDIITISQNKKVVALTGEYSVPLSMEKTHENPLANDIFTLDLFQRNPLSFFKAYFKLLKTMQNLQPGPIHKFLRTNNIPVLTQSFDGLHFSIGSFTIELHGNINFFKCDSCEHTRKAFFPKSYVNDDLDSLLQDLSCPICTSGIFRPNVVFVGEALRNFHEALNMLYESDVLLVIGEQKDLWPSNKIHSIATRQQMEIVIIDQLQCFNNQSN